jgi:hypothetical protein
VHDPVLPREGDAPPPDQEGGGELSPQFMAENVTAQGQSLQDMIKNGPKWMVKAISEDDINKVETLLKAPGGSLLLKETLNRKKQTALHLAAQNGCQEIVQLILNFQVDVNAQDKGGFTPLYLAAKNGHLGMMRRLWGRGPPEHRRDELIEGKSKDSFW